MAVIEEFPEEEDIPAPTDLKEQIQKTLTAIVHGFSQYFKDVAQKQFPDAKIQDELEFEDISVERRIEITGIYLVKVTFKAGENLKCSSAIAVKVYSSDIEESRLEEIINNMKSLEERLGENLEIQTPKIIFRSGGVVIMEGLTEAETFRKASIIPLPERLRLAGKALAKFHGNKPHKVNWKKYQLLTKGSLDVVPIDDQTRKTLKQKLADSLKDAAVAGKNGGSVCFGDLHSGNILYEVNRVKFPLLTTYLIDPEFLDSSTGSDRFEDITNFFVPSVVTSFSERGFNGLNDAITNIRMFLSGYNEILAQERVKIQDFYKDGILPINFHLSLGIILSILNYIQMRLSPDEETLVKEVSQRISLVLHLLDNPPIIE